MTKATRKQYTLEFKQEAVRLVESGQSLASAARTLGIIEQTLGNWVKAQRAGSLQAVSGGGAASYSYDGNGLRVIKSLQGGTTTVSIFAGSSVIAEYDNGV